MQSGDQQLAALKQLLHTLGHTDVVDHHVLYPGHRREKLLRGLMSRILRGRNIDELSLSNNISLEGLAEDERFAERCRQMLQMLGVAATTEEIRGCSSNQHKDTALLFQLAQLMQAVEQQRRSADATAAAVAGVATCTPAPSDAAVTQLISTACTNLSKVTRDAMQLFASDLNDVLKRYSDQGPAQQVPQLHQQTVRKLQQLQQQLQQVRVAGGERCENAGSEAWQQQTELVEAELDKLLTAAQHFDTTYQQELSVWAEVADDYQHMHRLGLQVTHEADSTMEVAEGVGMAARRIVAGYKDVTAALEGFVGIRRHHQALQDVPAALLQERTAVHHEEACTYSSAAAVLKPDFK